MTHRRVRRKMKATNYIVRGSITRYGQLPVQGVNRFNRSASIPLTFLHDDRSHDAQSRTTRRRHGVDVPLTHIGFIRAHLANDSSVPPSLTSLLPALSVFHFLRVADNVNKLFVGSRACARSKKRKKKEVPSSRRARFRLEALCDGKSAGNQVRVSWQRRKSSVRQWRPYSSYTSAESVNCSVSRAIRVTSNAERDTRAQK